MAADRTCAECGEGLRHDTKGERCRSCIGAETDRRRQKVVEWVAAGSSTGEIASRLGVTAHHMSTELCRMRRLGYDIPPFKISKGRVSNKPLRDELKRTGTSPNDVADRLGWYRNRQTANEPDGTRVRTLLGLRPTTTVKRGKRYSSTQTSITEGHALAIADALNLDPHEIDL